MFSFRVYWVAMSVTLTITAMGAGASYLLGLIAVYANHPP